MKLKEHWRTDTLPLHMQLRPCHKLTPRLIGAAKWRGSCLCSGALGKGGPLNQPFTERRILLAFKTSATWMK